MKHIQVFADAETLAGGAAAFLLDRARDAVHSSGRFTLALSGGHTPELLFSRLAEPPFRAQFPWENTFIFWGDERCVPFNDERSNARMAHAKLLDRVEIPPRNIFRIPVELSPEEAARQYEQTILDTFHPALPCFDLILLGLGNDGHTASLFPGTAILNEQTHLVGAVYADSQQQYRITMTFPLLNQAHALLFLVAGKEKAGILKQVLDSEGNYPAQHIQPEKGDVYWYVDEKAADGLITQ